MLQVHSAPLLQWCIPPGLPAFNAQDLLARACTSLSPAQYLQGSSHSSSSHSKGWWLQAASAAQNIDWLCHRNRRRVHVPGFPSIMDCTRPCRNAVGSRSWPLRFTAAPLQAHKMCSPGGSYAPQLTVYPLSRCLHRFQQPYCNRKITAAAFDSYLAYAAASSTATITTNTAAPNAASAADTAACSGLGCSQELLDSIGALS